MSFHTDVDLRDVHITILAGGSGTRLWPHSRHDHPKQLLNLLGDRSMLQQTIDRLRPLVPIERTYILTGPDHARLIAEQLPDLPKENLFVEPSPRGTAPCLGLAAMRIRGKTGSSNSVMISLHADHAVERGDRFRAALAAAVATARQGYLVTIGIVPTHPDTGFGYIQRGERLSEEAESDVYRVTRFTEKPPLAQAESFVTSGQFYWNAGYFAWRVSDILAEFERQLPDIHRRLGQIAEKAGQPTLDKEVQGIWAGIRSTTIDVGIMENARHVAVVPADMGWSDIGSWASLLDLMPRNDEGNVILGQGQQVSLDTSDSLIYGSGRLVATVGLSNMIIVDTKDALLVLPKERAQDVSTLVKALRRLGLDDYL